MLLAAIFISPNHLSHIFGKNHDGFTINLGGNYIYELSESKKGVGKIKTKQINTAYIPGFWNINLKLVSALVGENGVGKTSIMDLFRLPSSYCWFVVEDNDQSIIVNNSLNWDVIYYSAFFKQNLYRAERENFYDYSKYSLLVDDTEYESLSIGPLLELHESEKLKRWIHFSRLKSTHGLLAGIELPIFEKVNLRINVFSISEHQTSYAFRSFFEAIETKLDIEREEREEQIIKELGLTIKQIRDDRGVGKEIRLELQIIKAVMNKVRNILESTGNKYLGEGNLKNDFSVASPSFASQKSSRLAFYKFLEHAYIKLKNGIEIQIPAEQVKLLIDTLISYIPNPEDIGNTDEMELSFDRALHAMDAYEEFLLAFKHDFAYDKKILMQFMPLRGMSSGEAGLYDLFSVLAEASKRFQNGLHINMGDFSKREIVSGQILLLLDEGDLGFHPEWKKRYVNAIVQAAPTLFPGKSVQVILTTHDPLTLSDFPRENVTYFKRLGEKTIDYPGKDMRSFGANISTLLKNAFFVKDGLIGDFAKAKIDWTIHKLNEWIEAKNGNEKVLPLERDLQKVKKVIGLIDEPIIQQKLLEMFHMVSGEDELSRRIREIELELKWLRNQKGGIE